MTWINNTMIERMTISNNIHSKYAVKMTKTTILNAHDRRPWRFSILPNGQITQLKRSSNEIENQLNDPPSSIVARARERENYKIKIHAESHRHRTVRFTLCLCRVSSTQSLFSFYVFFIRLRFNQAVVHVACAMHIISYIFEGRCDYETAKK